MAGEDNKVFEAIEKLEGEVTKAKERISRLERASAEHSVALAVASAYRVVDQPAAATAAQILREQQERERKVIEQLRKVAA